jgi:type VI secretion system secreted protein VgrG
MAYTQEERICQVSSPLGGEALLLADMSARESISSPFYFDMHFLSQTEDIDFAAVIGKPLCVQVTLGNGNDRYFHGIVSRFSQGSAEGGFASYRAEVVPWISLLRRRAGCRIFQHKTVPDIIKAVLTETGFGDVEFQLAGDFPEREYCVQYRETDLNFISRLAEEEGIGYFFRHSAERHTLVFFNSPSAAAPCPGQASVPYASAVGLSVIGASIREFSVERELASGRYSITDYNFEDPSMNLLATTLSSAPIGGNERFEIYDHPGEYLKLAEGERLVKFRMQAEEAASIKISAQSDCGAFVPGYRFDLQGHFRADYNTSYLLTHVTHQVSQAIASGAGGGESTYANTFSCIPHSVPFRPLQRTLKPVISGVQTATVVGASGKEIDVDDHGRVIVQFHWDREGKRDENSSCRVRSSQVWAGKGWGSVSIPRIGQEVIVDFLEGDPNRPMITGRVYNGQNKLPYGDGGVVSGLKSNTTPGGNGSNEMSMDDTKGKEKITIHAQYDMATTIEHDEAHTVKTGNRTINVDTGKHTEKIKGDTSITIVTGNYSRTVSTGTSTITVKGVVTEDFKASQGTTVAGAITITSTGGAITIDGANSITLKTGASKLFMDKAGEITLSGKNIKVIGTADVNLSAPKVGAAGGEEAKLGVGSNAVTCDKQKVNTSGAAINSTAVGMHEISGALVKIN